MAADHYNKYPNEISFSPYQLNMNDSSGIILLSWLSCFIPELSADMSWKQDVSVFFIVFLPTLVSYIRRFYQITIS